MMDLSVVKRYTGLGIVFCLLFLVIVVFPVSYAWSHNVPSLEIGTLQITTERGVSSFSASLYNPLDHEVSMDGFTIILLDSDGNEVLHEPIYVGEKLSSLEEKMIAVDTTVDLSGVVKAVYRFEG